LMYLTARVPNFAHATIATLASYITLTVYLQGLNPYLAAPLAFAFVGTLLLMLYWIVIRTLISHGATIISLTIATLAIELMIYSCINIYADNLTRIYKYFSRYFVLREADFTLMGLPGIFTVSITLTIAAVISLHLLLTRTRFGIAMRATVEDPALATVLGVNTDLINAVSWFIAGGLCGLAGALFPLWFQMSPMIGITLIITVMAGSILGGLSSIYGSLLGGFVVGLTEILLTGYLAEMIGPQIIAYKLLIPLFIMIIVLLFFPSGLIGFIERLRTR
ncbi:MAG: branched-chain amino acid ABC transporter permease, partial [Thermoprotei archaeon]